MYTKISQEELPVVNLKRNRIIKVMFAVTFFAIGVGLGVIIDRAINTLLYRSPYQETVPITTSIPCISPLSQGGEGPSSPLNIILMIGDGFGPAMATLTRTMNEDGILAFDEYLIGTVKTRSYDKLVTDSAAAATALSTGKKTFNNGVAIGSNRTAVGTIMEAALEEGKTCGIVCTTPIYHATPASFNAHADDRHKYAFITRQQIQSGVQLMFGGGRNQFDSPEIFQIAKLNYTIIFNASQLNSTQLPTLGIFALDTIEYEIDRPHVAPQQPSLLQMATTALNLFEEQKNEKGYFLMIEGSKIDLAEHLNDAVAAYYETAQFVEVFKLVMGIAKKRNDTLVIVTADHETGGISLGKSGPNVDPYSWYPDVLKRVTRSSQFIGQVLENTQDELLGIVFENYTGISLDSAQLNALISAKQNNSEMWYITSKLISDEANIGWTTLEHSGVDVNIYGYGPQIENFCGNIDNTDIGNNIARVFNWNLDAITEELRNFNTTG